MTINTVSVFCIVVSIVLISSHAQAIIQQCETDGPVDASEHMEETTNSRSFSYVKGLFLQEDASTSLIQPGQQPRFGALTSWSDIHEHLTETDAKLLLLVRHGEGMHNVVQAYVGEELWDTVTQKCFWKNASSGETYQLFDPALTEQGFKQAEDLRAILEGGDTQWEDLTGSQPHATIVSPLTRTLQTYAAVLGPWVAENEIIVDEYCRERFGHNTCDARSPVALTALQDKNNAEDISDIEHEIGCKAEHGLQDVCSNAKFHVTGEGLDLGLVSEKDIWWLSDKRETDAELIARANHFLERVYASVSEKVIFVVTHSGFLSAVLEAVGREPYSATNSELVPVLVTKNKVTTMT